MIKGMLRITHWYIEGPYTRGPDGDGPIACLSALCPACDFEHTFNVDLEGHGRWKKGSPVWTFDGNFETPTFNPSMLANKEGVNKHHPICHSFVTAGQWEFLNDSTHHMAGQTVPMIPPVEGMTFQRRHGWHLYPWTDENGEPLKK